MFFILFWLKKVIMAHFSNLQHFFADESDENVTEPLLSKTSISNMLFHLFYLVFYLHFCS